VIRTSIVLLCLLFQGAPVTYDALPIRFGILPAFPVASLVADGIVRIK
jgi:hypothetical protein